MRDRRNLMLLAHSLFWVSLVAISLGGFSVPVFGKHLSLEILLALFLLPPLGLLSWRMGRGLPPFGLKYYLRAFQLMGLLFWVFAVGWLWLFIAHMD